AVVYLEIDDCYIGVIEEDVVPLDKERPVGSEHPLEPDTHIAATGVPVRAEDVTGNVKLPHRETLADGAPSPLDVEQGLRRDPVAETGRNRPKPAHVAVKREVTINEADMVATEAGAIEHALNTEHPVGRKLIVAADLPASGEAALGETAVITQYRVVETVRYARPADVAADIAAGPQVDRRRSWRRLHRHVRCFCGTSQHRSGEHAHSNQQLSHKKPP